MRTINLKDLGRNEYRSAYPTGRCGIIFKNHPNTGESIEEEWSSIEGYNGLYEVSNYGRVRSWKNNRWGKSDSFRILKQTLNSKGYPRVTLTRPGLHRTYGTHRLVGHYFVPNSDNKPCINHKDGDKENPFFLNLEWCTRRENNRHARRSGLMEQRGENSPNAKLTKQEVLKIRSLYGAGEHSMTDLGKTFGVSRTSIGKIINRKSWKHI